MPTSFSFDDFWKLYPRKVAKKAARKAWAKLTQEQILVVQAQLPRYAAYVADRDEQYILHPSTYLNGERFEDELPKPSNPYQNHPDMR